MKQLLTLALVGIVLQANAVDRIVEEFGVPPTYPNIAAAITAASDGDRIIIKNRAGGVPWIETITVNKSLEFLSFDNDGSFIVQGNWTMTVANGRVIRIIGMHNTAGSILQTGSGSLNGTQISIIDSRFISGSINLVTIAIRAQVVGCTLESGNVSLTLGSVIGCNITNSIGQSINITANTTYLGDTAAVVGNIVNNLATTHALQLSTNAQVVHVRNNYIRHRAEGIRVLAGNTQAVANLVWNNTIVAETGASTNMGVHLTNLNASSVWEVMNNVVRANAGTTRRGIYNGGNIGSAQTNVYFNVLDESLTLAVSTGFTFVGNNVVDGFVVLNADGTFQGNSAGIDQANPAPPFYDLDLSPGDAGAYGGSYTLVNFHPLHSGAARVYLAGHPYNIREGATLRVKANAWDR